MPAFEGGCPARPFPPRRRPTTPDDSEPNFFGKDASRRATESLRDSPIEGPQERPDGSENIRSLRWSSCIIDTISPKSHSQTALSFSAMGANRLLSSASKDRLDWSQNDPNLATRLPADACADARAIVHLTPGGGPLPSTSTRVARAHQ